MFLVHHLTSAINADALRAPVILRRLLKEDTIVLIKAITTFLANIALTNCAFATCPLLDTIEYQGEKYGLATWTITPSNEKVREWIAHLPWCSAPGQGRAVYRVESGQVFLTAFRGCGSTLPVSDAFSQSGPRTLATWLNGKFDVAKGNCMGGWDPATEWFVVEKGSLIEFHQSGKWHD